VYDNIMEAVGITRDVLAAANGAGYALGAVVSAEEAATLPAGAILYSVSDARILHVFIRDDAMNNMARTRVILSGDGAGDNYNRRMRFGSGAGRIGGDFLLPDNPCPVNTTAEFLRQLPVGTRFFIGTDATNVWVRIENGFGYMGIRDTEALGWDVTPTALRRAYGYNDFGNQQLHILTIPDPNDPTRSIH
jgi:hypothetical protein